MDKYKKKTKGISPMDAALRFLGYRSRTVREVERHLDEKQYGEYEIMQVVDRLVELDLLNDRKFAEEYVASCLRTKPVSRRKLQMKLKEHEVPQEVIDDVLEAISDDSEVQCAVEVAEKYANIYSDLDPDERNKIVMRRLLSRGYSFSTSKDALEMISAELDDSDNE